MQICSEISTPVKTRSFNLERRYLVNSTFVCTKKLYLQDPNYFDRRKNMLHQCSRTERSYRTKNTAGVKGKPGYDCRLSKRWPVFMRCLILPVCSNSLKEICSKQQEYSHKIFLFPMGPQLWWWCQTCETMSSIICWESLWNSIGKS